MLRRFVGVVFQIDADAPSLDENEPCVDHGRQIRWYPRPAGNTLRLFTVRTALVSAMKIALTSASEALAPTNASSVDFSGRRHGVPRCDGCLRVPTRDVVLVVPDDEARHMILHAGSLFAVVPVASTFMTHARSDP